jgi:hypothetical protein
MYRLFNARLGRDEGRAGSSARSGIQRHRVLVIVIAAAVGPAVQVAGAGMTAQATTSGTVSAGTVGRVATTTRWGKALEVPGLGSLNVGGEAFVLSLACGSAGNCAAGGMYRDRHGLAQAYLVTQLRGRWGQAREVPGTAQLNTGGSAGIVAVSCPSAGRCTAVGVYADRRLRYWSFVVTERNGTWGKAASIPGLADLNVGGNAEVGGLSCAAAGDCTVVGYYTGRHGFRQVFVASARNGRWGKAAELPGLRALNTGGYVEVGAISCPKPGDCSVAGGYETGSAQIEAFVDDQRGGRWSTAEEVPGTAALNAGGNADVVSVSCAAVGDCSAGGSYVDASEQSQAFVVAAKNGVWGQAFEAPGTAALNTGSFASIDSVSCSAPGDCSAGGSYKDELGDTEALVITQTRGHWGTAAEAAGTAALNSRGIATVNSVSCWSPGQCSAGGTYRGDSGEQAFVMVQSHGTWGKAQQVPGTARLNAGRFAAIYAVSCRPAGWCGAGGVYRDSTHRAQAFVVSRA